MGVGSFYWWSRSAFLIGSANGIPSKVVFVILYFWLHCGTKDTLDRSYLSIAADESRYGPGIRSHRRIEPGGYSDITSLLPRSGTLPGKPGLLVGKPEKMASPFRIREILRFSEEHWLLSKT
ncbi:MAG: hypothetical protein AAF558_13060 [Verrucomicrobiota bacterium]